MDVSQRLKVLQHVCIPFQRHRPFIDPIRSRGISQRQCRPRSDRDLSRFVCRSTETPETVELSRVEHISESGKVHLHDLWALHNFSLPFDEIWYYMQSNDLFSHVSQRPTQALSFLTIPWKLYSANHTQASNLSVITSLKHWDLRLLLPKTCTQNLSSKKRWIAPIDILWH